MNIPKSLKIGGMTYRVEMVDELDDAVADIKPERSRIRILNVDRQTQELSLLHEILHAINYEWEEERVEFLAMALYQVIKDNPTLFSKGGDRK